MSLSSTNDKQREWINREITILNDPDLKQHPNIVKYVEYFIHEEFLNIVMEYYEGGTLYSFIRAKQGIPETTFAEFLEQLAEGLEFLHQKKIIHRDVKSKNILLTAHNDIKLADFGVARQLEEIQMKLTKKVGTLNNMSPEVLEGKQYDFKTDIWSLGCVCFEMGTGDFAYPGNKVKEIEEKVRSKQLPDFKRLKYSEPIKNIIHTMLDFNPETRPSASDVKASINKHKPDHIVNISCLKDLSKRGRTHRTSESNTLDTDSGLGSTRSGQSFLHKLSPQLQSAIVTMIGDHRATTKLERIMRFCRKNQTDYQGLETKVKDVVGETCAIKIYPFILALKGVQEGISKIPGITLDTEEDLSTTQGSTDNT